MRRRLSPRSRRAIFFLCAFLFGLMATIPLSVGLGWLELEERGLAAREAEGTIWFGALREAQMGPIEGGDVVTRLRTLPLFLGRARLELARPGAADRLSGAVIVSRHGFGVDDLTASLRLAAPIGALPLAAVEPADLSLGFSEGSCRSAGGLVRASLSAGGSTGLPATLSGHARCERGALLLPLSSQSGMETLNLRIGADGRYRAELIVRPSDPGVVERLRASGFAPSGPGYALRFEGNF